MMIYNEKLSVVPITTHINLKQVSSKISKSLIFNKILNLRSCFKKNFGIDPRIAVLGLNPHNGEMRKNTEENRIIIPALKKKTIYLIIIMLKKYLIYSKRFMKPKLSEVDQNKITQFYADVRRESNSCGGIPIAVRHIESVIRMSEAFAKIHLRDHVRSTDVDMAIEMLLESFLQS